MFSQLFSKIRCTSFSYNHVYPKVTRLCDTVIAIDALLLTTTRKYGVIIVPTHNTQQTTGTMEEPPNQVEDLTGNRRLWIFTSCDEYSRAAVSRLHNNWQIDNINDNLPSKFSDKSLANDAPFVTCSSADKQTTGARRANISHVRDDCAEPGKDWSSLRIFIYSFLYWISQRKGADAYLQLARYVVHWIHDSRINVYV